MMVVHLLDKAAKRAGLDLTPPERVQSIARAALERRTEEPGSTLERARIAKALVAGEPLPAADLRAIASHADADGLRLALCGGMWGVAWARRTLELVEAAAAVQPPEDRDHGLALVLGRAAPSADRAEDDASQEREAAWRAWDRTVRRPSERQLRRAVQAFLAEQGERIAERAAERLGDRMRIAPMARGLSDEDLLDILNDIEEARRFREKLGEHIRAVLVRAFALAAREVAIQGITWDASLDPADQMIGELIVQISQTTRDAVKRALTESLETGETIADMQDRIKGLPEFSPRRALRVARTESAKLASTGANMAYQQAEDRGVRLEREWLSSRDDAVRESHQALDGQRARPGERWTFPSGITTEGPGLSGVASEDINCRCGTRARVLERPEEAA